MTVHARQLARLCRERLTAQQDLPVLKQQPEQQQAARSDDAADSQDNTNGTEQAVR